MGGHESFLMSRGHNCYNGYFTWNFIEIPSNSLFISSRMTRGQIQDIKLMITIIIIIIMIILIIIIMYFTTLEHLKAGIKGEELLYPDTLSYGCAYELKEH